MTFYEAAASARAELVTSGIRPETAARDAELLARDVAGWDLATWLARRTEPVDPGFAARYATLVERRRKREPMAYIRGVQEFWGREFRVSPDVLIPRHETELLIETAGAFLPAHPDATVVDVGTGSGCIAITLALEHPSISMYAVDVSAPALTVARENARRFGARGVRFVEGAYLATVPRPVDLIVSNPPYVAGRDAPALQPEVRDYEPAVALFGGDDGWRDIRQLLDEAASALAREGRLMMEVGYGQFERLDAVAASVRGLTLERMHPDIQGIPRIAILRRAD